MTKPLRYLIILSAVLLAASCTDNPRYSPLDGFWQVTQVEDKAAGRTTEGNNQLYINFEYELVRLSYFPANRNPGTSAREYTGSFTLQGDTIRFSPFYPYLKENAEAPAEALAPFGLTQGRNAFAISIHKGQMTLENDRSKLSLIRY